MKATFILCLILVAQRSLGAQQTNPQSNYDKDVAALDSNSPTERSEAKRHLSEGGQGAVSAILNGMDSLGRQAKGKAIELIREIHWSSKDSDRDGSARSLGQKSRAEKDIIAKQQMIVAIRTLGGPVALDEMRLSATTDSNPGVRAIATHYVAQMSTPEAEREFFIRQTKDAALRVRLAAFAELAELGDRSGRELALDTVSKSQDDYEQDEAMWVLGACGNPDDSAILRPLSKEVSHRGVHAFRAMKRIELLQSSFDGRLEKLIKSLDDPSIQVREWAGLELHRLRDPRTSEALKKYLKETGHVGYREASMALGAR